MLTTREYIEVGSGPCDSPVAQVGSSTYSTRAYAECRLWIDQLRRTFGPEPLGAHLSVKSFPHDFGRYYEVVCYYDPDSPEERTYAMRCEGEAPERWDNDAIRQLPWLFEAAEHRGSTEIA